MLNFAFADFTHNLIMCGKNLMLGQCVSSTYTHKFHQGPKLCRIRKVECPILYTPPCLIWAQHNYTWLRLDTIYMHVICMLYPRINSLLKLTVYLYYEKASVTLFTSI